MDEELAKEKALRIKVCVELGDLPSKQRSAVFGIIKDLGFQPEEISEVAVTVPPSSECENNRHQKWR